MLNSLFSGGYSPGLGFGGQSGGGGGGDLTSLLQVLYQFLQQQGGGQQQMGSNGLTAFNPGANATLGNFQGAFQGGGLTDQTVGNPVNPIINPMNPMTPTFQHDVSNYAENVSLPGLRVFGTV
jgi:hypothetical protein